MPFPDVAALSDEEHGDDGPASSARKRKRQETSHHASHVGQTPTMTVNLRKLVWKKCQCSRKKCMQHFQDDGKQRELRALRLHMMSMNKLDSDKFAACIKYCFDKHVITLHSVS